MAWEKRRGRQFYYRSQRVNGYVRKVYLGSGDVAKQAAEKDAAILRERGPRDELDALVTWTSSHLDLAD